MWAHVAVATSVLSAIAQSPTWELPEGEVTNFLMLSSGHKLGMLQVLEKCPGKNRVDRGGKPFSTAWPPSQGRRRRKTKFFPKV